MPAKVPAPTTAPTTAPATAPTAPANPTGQPSAMVMPTPAGATPSSVSMAPSTTMLPGSWAEGPMVQFSPDNPAARLERWEYNPAEKQSTWKLVCTGACTQPMDTRFGYRVTGDRIVTSTWFQLPRSAEPMKLTAETGGKGARTAGEVLVWAGPVIAVVGVVVLAPTHSDDGTTNRSAWDTRTIVGTTVLGVGLAALFTGLAVIGATSTSATADRANAPAAARFKLTPTGFSF